MAKAGSVQGRGAARAGGKGRFAAWLLRARLRYARSAPGRWRLTAARFVLVPPQLAPADPSIAEDILAGQVVLAGKSLLLSGAGLFDHPPPSPAFAEALHDFGWLRHFEASREAPVREGALDLLDAWMARRESGHWPEAEAPAVVPRRLVAFVLHGGLVGAQPDMASYARLLRHMARDAAMARVLAATRGIGMVRLEAAIAFTYYALAMDRPPRLLWQAEAALAAAFDECVLHDGAPRNRDPGTAVTLAAMIVPLLALYRARTLEAPDLLTQGLQRLVGFVRLMQHPEGGLALFNGGGLVERSLVAEVTRFAAASLARPTSAPDAGFERRENEHGILIVDSGPLAAPAFATQAAASALAFEFSTRAERLIVNCGRPVGASEDVLRFFRSPAAHSSVLIDDTGPTELVAGETLLESEALMPGGGDGLEPQDEADGTLVVGHGGLGAQTGYVIERRFRLLPEGGLEGADYFREINERGEIRRGTLAFHLHPQVIPVPLSRRDAVVLRLPNQPPGEDLWVFEAEGHTLGIEESRCFLDDFSSSKTTCLVLDAAVSGNTVIRWRLHRYFG